VNEQVVEVLDAELVGNELVKVEQQAGLAEDAALVLRDQFGTYYNEIVTLREQAVTVTDPENVTHQKIARTVRLGLKKVRCSIETVRKQLKAESLARGKAVDGFANVIKYLCEPVEEKLAAVEQYAERQEAARVAALVQERAAALVAVECDPHLYNLGVMDDETFRLVLDGAKERQAQRVEADRVAEAQRIEREQADRIAREKAEADAAAARAEAEKERKAREASEKAAKAEREKAEKARLAAEAKAKAEADAAAAKAKAERDAAEAAALAERAKIERRMQAEREAREQAEANVRAAQDREAARVAAEQAAQEAAAQAEREEAERAARAPDRDKLLSFAEQLGGLMVPAMATDEGRAAGVAVGARLASLVVYVRNAAEWM